jgi:hypothetical protein
MDTDDMFIISCIALAAAAMSWSGISAVKRRDDSILETAEVFEEWLMNRAQQ